MRVVVIKIVIWEVKRKIYIPVFDKIINIKLLNENLKEVAICKHCKNVLILAEKASQHAGLATELAFKCANDKCKLHHKKNFLPLQNPEVYMI